MTTGQLVPARPFDDLTILAAEPWLRELVIAAGGRPPQAMLGGDFQEETTRWRGRYKRALAAWHSGRRAKAIKLLAECAALVSTLRDERNREVEKGFVAYVESRFRCALHDDCLRFPDMAHDCWLEQPERAR